MFRRVLESYRRSAKSRGYPWELTPDEFLAITTRACHYCGRAPSNRRQENGDDRVYVYSGVDRVDNTCGYTPNNVVPCCVACNHAKSAMSVTEFIDLCSRVAAQAEARILQ